MSKAEWTLEMLRALGQRALREGGAEEILVRAALRSEREGYFDESGVMQMGTTLRVTKEWARCGFPTVRMSEKLAASFMVTKVPQNVVPEEIAPWETALFVLPNNTLVDHEFTPENGWADPVFVDSMFVQYQSPQNQTEHLSLGINSTHASWIIWRFIKEAGLMAPLKIRSIEEMIWQSEHAKGGPGNPLGEMVDFDPKRHNYDKTAVEGTSRMSLRFVMGTLIELGAERARIERERRVQNRADFIRARRRSKIPNAWDFQISRDVVIDCSSAVKQASLGGKGKPLTLQSLVRGHWKNQPCGPQSSLRKFIHIEPFWRGPEDAPIAVRSHILKGEAAQ